MHEFENVSYIDLQKTGSTTIVSVLTDVLDEKEVHRDIHGPVPSGFDRSKLSFISVREPLSLYISLFNFGVVTKRGTLYNALRKAGRASAFEPTADGFAEWLDFLLDPKNAPTFNRKYGADAPFDCLGLLSNRLLFMTVPRFKNKVKKSKLQNPQDIRELFARRHIFDDYVRTENLSGDLFAFLHRHAGRLRLRQSLTTADDLIARVPVLNASRKAKGLHAESVPDDLRQRVREREWLLYETFGYDVDPRGRPPQCLSAASPAARHGRVLPDPGRYQEGDREQGTGFAIASKQPEAIGGVADIE